MITDSFLFCGLSCAKQARTTPETSISSSSFHSLDSGTFLVVFPYLLREPFMLLCVGHSLAFCIKLQDVGVFVVLPKVYLNLHLPQIPVWLSSTTAASGFTHCCCLFAKYQDDLLAFDSASGHAN